MNCREIQERLADDTNAAMVDAGIAGHLKECPACRGLLDRLSEADDLLAALPKSEPSDELIQRTRKALEDQPVRLRRAYRLALAVGAPVVLLLVVSVFFVGGMSKEASRSANALAGRDDVVSVPDRYVQLETDAPMQLGAGGVARGGRYSIGAPGGDTGVDNQRNLETTRTTGWLGVDKERKKGRELGGQDASLRDLEKRVEGLKEKAFHSRPKLSLLQDQTDVGDTYQYGDTDADGIRDLPDVGEVDLSETEQEGEYWNDESGVAKGGDGKVATKLIRIPQDPHGSYPWGEDERRPYFGPEEVDTPPNLPRANEPVSGKGEKPADDGPVVLNKQSILRNPEQLARQARIIPTFRNGKATGFKVHGVRPGSTLEKLGVKNGDVIETIDGQSVTSPDKALELYQRVQTKNEIELGLDRDGEQVALNLKLDQVDKLEESDETNRLATTKDVERVSSSDSTRRSEEEAQKVFQEEVRKRNIRRELSKEGKEDSGLDSDGGFGRLVIRSDPPAARVIIDGRAVDPSPSRPLPVPPGRHRVRVTRPGYRDATWELDVKSKELITLELPPAGKKGKLGGEGNSAFVTSVENDRSQGTATKGDEESEHLIPLAGKRGRDLDPSDAITIAKPQVMGSLDKDLINRSVQAQGQALRSCYETGLKRDAALRGEMGVRFVIQPDGQVGQSAVSRSTLGDRSIETCIADRVAQMRFPAPKGGGIVVVDYPFRFGEPASGQSNLAAELEAEYLPLDQLTFVPSSGYFRNTYLPGDPEIQWLRQSLASGLYLEGERLALEQAARPYAQPFDAPQADGLAVYMSADTSAVEQPTRLRIQVGLKGSERHARRRAPLSAALVIDLREVPDEQARQSLWSLADALATSSQAGDRFWLFAAGAAKPLLVEPGRFDPTTLRRSLARALLELEQAKAPEGGLQVAVEEAYAVLSGQGSGQAPLGANLVLVATTAARVGELTALTDVAHARAVEGITTSALGVGPLADSRALANLSLAGQGRRRLIASADQARRVIEAELSASGSVVARAVRLRIRLAEGVKLVSVLGSESLDTVRSERVRKAEQAIDRKISSTLGIKADRGEDEEGIQIVIPAYYAGDEHVVLLDVVAAGPGPLADVQVRYKDLVNLRNSVAHTRLRLATGLRADDPRTLNVKKNHLAHQLSRDLDRAARALRSGRFERCRHLLALAVERIARLRREVPQLQDDPELRRDDAMLANYRRVIDDRAAWKDSPQVRNHLARSLALASRRKLTTGK